MNHFLDARIERAATDLGVRLAAGLFSELDDGMRSDLVDLADEMLGWARETRRPTSAPAAPPVPPTAPPARNNAGHIVSLLQAFAGEGPMFAFIARVAGLPRTGCDTLLCLADALRDAAADELSRGNPANAATIHAVAGLLAELAPQRAR